VISAPPPARLIARSPYAVSFCVEVLLGKYNYGQPSNRLLQDLADQGLPVSRGTLAGGRQRLAGLFEPVLEALYCNQMSEALCHNDETRWEVFVDLEGNQTHHAPDAGVAGDAGTGDGSSLAGGSMASSQSGESVVCSSLKLPPKSTPLAFWS